MGEAAAADDEDVDQVAARIVASVFGPDPDFGTGTARRCPAPNGHHRTNGHRGRLLSDELVAEILKQAKEIGLR